MLKFGLYLPLLAFLSIVPLFQAQAENNIHHYTITETKDSLPVVEVNAQESVAIYPSGVWVGDITTDLWAFSSKVCLEGLDSKPQGCVNPLTLDRDRYSHVKARIYKTSEQKEITMQEMLVGEGRLRYYPSGSTGFDQRLQRAEKEARALQKGRWKDQWQLLSADSITEENFYSFQIVTGSVKEVSQFGKRVFLNFGENWRDDFTVMSNKATIKKLINILGIEEIEQLVGQELIMRGYLREYNGPLIEVYDPYQISYNNVDFTVTERVENAASDTR